MRRIVPLFVLCGRLTCGDGVRPAKVDLPVAIDAAPLLGSWEGQLATWRGFFGRFGPARRSPLVVRFSNVMQEKTTDFAGREREWRTARGSYYLRNLTSLAGSPHGPDATGALLVGDSVFLRLGGCCDSGEIEVTGSLRGNAIVGTWVQVTREPPTPYGTVELHRGPSQDR